MKKTFFNKLRQLALPQYQRDMEDCRTLFESEGRFLDRYAADHPLYLNYRGGSLVNNWNCVERFERLCRNAQVFEKRLHLLNEELKKSVLTAIDRREMDKWTEAETLQKINLHIRWMEEAPIREAEEAKQREELKSVIAKKIRRGLARSNVEDNTFEIGGNGTVFSRQSSFGYQPSTIFIVCSKHESDQLVKAVLKEHFPDVQLRTFKSTLSVEVLEISRFKPKQSDLDGNWNLEWLDYYLLHTDENDIWPTVTLRRVSKQLDEWAYRTTLGTFTKRRDAFSRYPNATMTNKTRPMRESVFRVKGTFFRNFALERYSNREDRKKGESAQKFVDEVVELNYSMMMSLLISLINEFGRSHMEVVYKGLLWTKCGGSPRSFESFWKNVPTEKDLRKRFPSVRELAGILDCLISDRRKAFFQILDNISLTILLYAAQRASWQELDEFLELLVIDEYSADKGLLSELRDLAKKNNDEAKQTEKDRREAEKKKVEAEVLLNEALEARKKVQKDLDRSKKLFAEYETRTTYRNTQQSEFRKKIEGAYKQMHGLQVPKNEFAAQMQNICNEFAETINDQDIKWLQELVDEYEF